MFGAQLKTLYDYSLYKKENIPKDATTRGQGVTIGDPEDTRNTATRGHRPMQEDKCDKKRKGVKRKNMKYKVNTTGGHEVMRTRGTR